MKSKNNFCLTKQNSSVEIIKSSKFLSFVLKVNNLDDIDNFLLNIKKEHKNATHVCYAYILDKDTFKYSDDGEPSGSAGMPILKSLTNNKMLYTLAVVVRYFGGVKFGVGLLSRTYGNLINNLIINTDKVIFEEKNLYILKYPINIHDKLNYHLTKNNIIIKNINFSQIVETTIETTKEKFEILHKKFKNFLLL